MSNLPQLELRVGILVLAGLAALVTTVLASDKVSFEGNYPVTIYMNDAGNLRVGSPVRLSGIRIGAVEQILPSDDVRGSIQATVSIGRSVLLYENSEVTLATDGILGDSHLSFSAPGTERGQALAQDGSATRIASATFLSQAADKIGSLLDAMVDMTDLETRNEVKQLVTNASAFAEQGAAAIADIRSLRQRLDHSLDRVDALLAMAERDGARVSEQMGQTLTQATASLQAMDAHLARLAPVYEQLGVQAESAMDGINRASRRIDLLLEAEAPTVRTSLAELQGLLAGLRSVVAGVESGRGVIGQLLNSDALAADVHQTMVGAAQMVERVSRDPQILVWGPGEDENEAARRRREQQLMRRAFMEGYRIPPGRTLDEPRPADDASPSAE